MPETIGLLVLTSLGVTEIAGFAVTASTYAIVGNIVLAAGAYGLSAALAPQKPQATQQDGQITLRQPRAPRRRNYGTVKVGGVLMFSETRTGTRFQMFAISHGEIDAFVEHWLADVQAAIGAASKVTNLYVLNGTSFVTIEAWLGTQTDPASTTLITYFPSYWDVTFQGKEIAKVLTTTSQPASEDFTKVYPGGQPPIYRGVIRASRVWDPRDGAQDKDNRDTWTFTENPVLIALDFHRHPDGMGLAIFDDVFFTPAAIIEDWIPSANICDEPIALKAGGTEPRYRCSGGYELPAPPKQVLNVVLGSCDGETFQRADGAIGIRVGKLVAPNVAITDQHILSYSNFVRGASGGITPVNVVTAKYTARDLDYQEADADPWRDEDSISETGREESRNLDLTWVPSHSQARRLMKIAARRFNPNWTGQIITDLDGLRAYGLRYVTLQISELEIDDPFEMVSFEIVPASMNMIISVRSFDQTAYDWDPEHEEGTAPNQANTSAIDDSIDNPNNVQATVASHVISVTWDASGRLDTTPALQYRTNSSGPWIDGVIDSSTSGHTPSLSAAHYDVQVQFIVGSHSSGWSPLLNINVT